MCFITILLRKCEEVKRVARARGATRRGRKVGAKAGRLCRATANMTASGKRFIIYLSAEIGTAAQRGGAGAVALLVLPGAAAAAGT